MPTEKDSMGQVSVPDDALWGASTQRALLNFPENGPKIPFQFVQAGALIKWAAAKTNTQLGVLKKEKAKLIESIALDIYEGKYANQFRLSVFQTGSATSVNMNLNEVISKQGKLISQKINKQIILHPNDDVNKSQSSNDTMPAALHISVALAIHKNLLPNLHTLHKALIKKTNEFKNILKIGRTHLMDATPISLSQVFSGYTRQIEKSIQRSEQALQWLLELAIGGTAVGTGINCPKDFPKICIAHIAKKTKLNFIETHNHFEAQAARDDCVQVANTLNTIAVSLSKIANDIRLMGSGPRAGFFELNLPPVQPGSSIMPGKTNPVMCEMLIQACLYTLGHSQMASSCGTEGYFELNTSIPLMSYSLLSSIEVLSESIKLFTAKCIIGLEANSHICKTGLENSLMLATALAPYIGYDKTAQVAKKAFLENKTLKNTLLELNFLSKESIDKILDPSCMI